MNDEAEEILSKLKEEHDIEDLVTFTDIDVQEKLKENSYLAMKYKELWIKEKVVLENLQDKMDKLKAMRYHYYRFEQDEAMTKPEIEKYYLPGDRKILQMNKILRKQQVRVDFFEACWRGLDKMGWNMKNFCENERRGY